MFKLIYGDDLFDFPELANEMFQDRKSQFCDAFGWDLEVDALGREIDKYDLMNPLYVILRDKSGHHLGSGRLMPTTGPTMIADHFSDMTDGVEVDLLGVGLGLAGAVGVAGAPATVHGQHELARRGHQLLGQAGLEPGVGVAPEHRPGQEAPGGEEGVEQVAAVPARVEDAGRAELRDRLGAVAEDRGALVAPGLREPGQGVLEQGAAAQGQQALGARGGEPAAARAAAGRDQDRPHAWASRRRRSPSVKAAMSRVESRALPPSR